MIVSSKNLAPGDVFGFVSYGHDSRHSRKRTICFCLSNCEFVDQTFISRKISFICHRDLDHDIPLNDIETWFFSTKTEFDVFHKI